MLHLQCLHHPPSELMDLVLRRVLPLQWQRESGSQPAPYGTSSMVAGEFYRRAYFHGSYTFLDATALSCCHLQRARRMLSWRSCWPRRSTRRSASARQQPRRRCASDLKLCDPGYDCIPETPTASDDIIICLLPCRKKLAPAPKKPSLWPWWHLRRSQT